MYGNRQAIGKCQGCKDQILSDEVYGFIDRKPVHNDPECIPEGAEFIPAKEYAGDSKPKMNPLFEEIFEAFIPGYKAS
jgi:hypothetical protein